MTIKSFLIMYIILTAIASLLTEAIKRWIKNKGAKYSYNTISLVVTLVVGGVGTSIYYVMNNIQFNLQNIAWLLVSTFFVWIGSMIGYDKIKQMIEQLVENK